MVGEFDFGSADGVGELVEGSRSDDGGGDGGVMEEPGEGDVGGLFAEFVAEVFVALELWSGGLDAFIEVVCSSSSFVEFFECAAEESAGEGAPGDDTEAVVSGGGEDFEFDHTVV